MFLLQQHPWTLNKPKVQAEELVLRRATDKLIFVRNPQLLIKIFPSTWHVSTEMARLKNLIHCNILNSKISFREFSLNRPNLNGFCKLRS